MTTTLRIRLNSDFLAEAAPMLDDATGYPADGRDEFLAAFAPIVAKIAAAEAQRDWSVTIDVTRPEADVILDEAEYRRDVAPDERIARSCQQVADRCKVIVHDLAPFVAV